MVTFTELWNKFNFNIRFKLKFKHNNTSSGSYQALNSAQMNYKTWKVIIYQNLEALCAAYTGIKRVRSTQRFVQFAGIQMLTQGQRGKTSVGITQANAPTQVGNIQNSLSPPKSRQHSTFTSTKGKKTIQELHLQAFVKIHNSASSISKEHCSTALTSAKTPFG